MYIYKTKTKTETKTKTREGGGRWVRREWGEGGEGEGHASVQWNITIQKHHTVLPYRLSCDKI
jgi:hypothetical protein